MNGLNNGLQPRKLLPIGIDAEHHARVLVANDFGNVMLSKARVLECRHS